MIRQSSSRSSSSSLLSYWKGSSSAPPPYVATASSTTSTEIERPFLTNLCFNEQERMAQQGNELLKIGLLSNDRAIVIHGLSYILKSLGQLSPSEQVQLCNERQTETLPTGYNGPNIEETVENIVRFLFALYGVLLPYVLFTMDQIWQQSRAALESRTGRRALVFVHSVIRGMCRGIHASRA